MPNFIEWHFTPAVAVILPFRIQYSICILIYLHMLCNRFSVYLNIYNILNHSSKNIAESTMSLVSLVSLLLMSSSLTLPSWSLYPFSSLCLPFPNFTIIITHCESNEIKILYRAYRRTAQCMCMHSCVCAHRTKSTQ